MSGFIDMTDPHKTRTSEMQPLNSKHQSSGLQMKLQKQRNNIRNGQPRSSDNLLVNNGPKKSSLMSAARLQIPRSGGYQKLDSSLVQLESDSEDELFLSGNVASSARQVNKQLSRQLARDGFQLDEIPDDEALDLIPPSDFRDPDSCNCCSIYYKDCLIL